MASIDLTQGQLDSIDAQRAGTAPQPPQPQQPPVTPPYIPPPPNPEGMNIKDVELYWNGGGPPRIETGLYGGFGTNDIFAFHFKTGPGPSQPNNLPHISAAEFGAGAVNRIWALSDKRADFQGLPAFASTGHSSGITAAFTVTTPDFNGIYPVLDPNKDYWLNVKLAPVQEIGSDVTDARMTINLQHNGCP